MKIKFFLTALLFTLCFSTFAQRSDNSWRNRIKSEKIGFITTAIDLTPEEAQSFWPVYNKIFNVRDEAMRNMFDALKKLQSAINEKKSDKEISSLLNDYLKAQAEANSLDVKFAKEYEKILPAYKVARLFIAEEDFRKMQIQRLGSPRDRIEDGSESRRHQ